MRWAVPLLKAKQGSIPATHEACAEASIPCLACLAGRHLTSDDRAAVRFYERVRDQVVNHTPFSEPPWIAPRLEAWNLQADLLGIPVEERAELFDACRSIMAFEQGRDLEFGIHGLIPQDLAPPPELICCG